MKARYRNKLNKIIIELFYEGKWYYIKTLPAPQTLFFKECLEKVSFLEAQKQNKTEIKPQEVPLIIINRNLEKQENKTLNTLDGSTGNIERSRNNNLGGSSSSQELFQDNSFVHPEKKLTKEEIERLAYELSK